MGIYTPDSYQIWQVWQAFAMHNDPEAPNSSKIKLTLAIYDVLNKNYML